jgi:hypothetical protein
MKKCAAAALGLLCTSCMLLGRAKVEELYFRAGEPEPGSYYHLVLQELAVEKDLDGPALRKNAGYIFELLDSRYTRERGGSSVLIARVFLKEEPILRELETLNTVTLEIRLTGAEEQEPEILYLFTEETPRSLSSYAYLYTLIEHAFRSIFP